MLPSLHWKQWLGIALLVFGFGAFILPALGGHPTSGNSSSADAFGGGAALALGAVMLYLGSQDRARERRERDEYFRQLDRRD